MRLSKNGKSVYLEIGFWVAEDGSIHVAAKDIEGFNIAVNSDPGKSNGHPTLFKRLAKCLSDMGASAPMLTEVK
jgi:hypothetical protein